MTDGQHEKPVRVGIGLVARDSAYLIRRRPPGGPMPGVWEFPGGKCLDGETPAEATARECREETGLEVVVQRLRRRLEHRYPHGWVELWYYDCTLADPSAVPDPRTGFRWVAACELPALTFPPANEPVLAELAQSTRAGEPL